MCPTSSLSAATSDVRRACSLAPQATGRDNMRSARTPETHAHAPSVIDELDASLRAVESARPTVRVSCLRWVEPQLAAAPAPGHREAPWPGGSAAVEPVRRTSRSISVRAVGSDSLREASSRSRNAGGSCSRDQSRYERRSRARSLRAARDPERCSPPSAGVARSASGSTRSCARFVLQYQYE